MKDKYIEQIYSGWLAKSIGIRLGAPIEGWTYDRIKRHYGAPDSYIVNYKRFAADDDSNGPMFFIRALEDKVKEDTLDANDVANALLNYAPFEHGFFWWGGYGVSTEHTAYLNLVNGIPAPQSGSILQNGHATAEQIGGQIFIDSWGLVNPGNPDRAAKLAEKAASVTHDGNGIYGGVFIAVCISYSFVENNIRRIIDKGLSYIPSNSEYAKIVNAVINFYDENPNDWELCYRYIHDNFGYDKYPGVCHIIPNTAVMILSLLYGEGDFSNTINICNLCGWDTDCNVGNVATIMGVRNGLDGIDFDKWRAPINDFLVFSSVLGSLNISDIPFGATYMAKLAYELDNEPIPELWQSIMNRNYPHSHFEFPGSTHAMQVRVESMDFRVTKERPFVIENTDEWANSGQRSLKVIVNSLEPGECIQIFKETYLLPDDFNDNRYEPSFSPLIYPGQRVFGSIAMAEYGPGASVALYVKNQKDNMIHLGEAVILEPGESINMVFDIPYIPESILSEVGFSISVNGTHPNSYDAVAFIDDLYWEGNPNYNIDFSKETVESWTPKQNEISQMTKLKGLMYLENKQLHLSCSDFAECYTGSIDWDNYISRFTIVPIYGTDLLVNIRVQGALRSYALGFSSDDQLKFFKKDSQYKELTSSNFVWENGKKYEVEITAQEDKFLVKVDDVEIMSYTDRDKPYLTGCIGISVRNGSHIACNEIEVRPL